MVRRHGTDRAGHEFPEIVKRAVWSRALGAPAKDLREWRQDPCGALINWFHYGETSERGFGWEIDHILPVAHGGGDDLANLQALQWQNNRRKSDSLEPTGCAIVAAS